MGISTSIGEDFVRWTPPTGSDRALGVVDFSIFPSSDHEELAGNSMDEADDSSPAMPSETAQSGRRNVEVVSEGHWRLFSPTLELVSEKQRGTR